jgi:uncharacterized membrane protein YphA (DoxX/SURF4 family)
LPQLSGWAYTEQSIASEIMGMDGVLLTARLLLAGVFAVAGAAKLMDPAGTRRALTGFGVPDRLAGSLALALPIMELALAAALLPLASARLAAIAAVALLLAFLTAIVGNLVQGRKPDCRCFGQWRATPIGASTVVLNLALIAMAGLCAWSPGPSVVAWLDTFTVFERVAIVAGAMAMIGIAATVWLLWQMLQQQRTLSARLEQWESRLAGRSTPPAKSTHEGLPIGSKAPSFALDALGGGHAMLDNLLAAGKPVLLVFTDPDCEACEAMLPDLVRWQHDPSFTLAVVSAGTPEENQSLAAHGLQHVALQWKAEVADDYECAGTPGAVLVRPDGTIGSAIAGGREAIARLVASLAAAPAQAPRIGATLFLRRSGIS